MAVPIHKILFFALLVFTTACAKTANSVFGEANNTTQSTCSNTRIQNRFLVIWEDGRITAHTEENSEKFIENFVKPNLENIQNVEFDKMIRVATDVRTSADPTEPEDWGQTMSEAPALWAQGVRGQNIIVGVVDTGVDYSHPQLATRLAVNSQEFNGVVGFDDDSNGFIDDVYGWNFVDESAGPKLLQDEDHGTHVSGIIAADSSSGSVKGMAPQAKIVPAKFLGGDGSGTTSGAIAALNYAVSRGAKIINASWGGSQCSLSLQKSFEKISAQGVLLMAAAGNEGHDLDVSPDYPAVINVPNQITVSAVRSDGYMAAFSNSSYQYAHIVAPGDHIFSLRPGNSTRYMNGTSMATPFVSGAAALLWSAKPNATAGQIRQAIVQGIDSGQYRVSSQGRLNVRKALDVLRTLIP